MASYTIKSFVLDVADNYGRSSVGIRSIEFRLSGILVGVLYSDATCYGSQYSDDYSPIKMFDTAPLKTGLSIRSSWYSASGVNTNVRISCVFDTPIVCDSVVVNNYHSNGASTDGGAKNIRITITASGVVTSTTYMEAVPNGFLLFDGVLDEHVASNVVDNQVLLLNEPPPEFNVVSARGAEGEAAEQGLFGAVSRGAKGIATTSNFCEVVPARGAKGAVSIQGLCGTTSRGMVTNTEYPYDVTSDVVVNASGSRTLEGDVIDSEVGRVERAISGRGAIASLGFEGNACSSRGFTCDVSQVFLVSALAGSGRGAVAHLGSLLDTRSARGVAGTATQKHSGNLKACSSRGSFLTVVDRNVSIKACRSCCAIGQVTIDGIATGIVCNGRGLEGDVVKNGIIDGTVCGRRGCKCSVLTELFADGDIYQSRGLGKEINIIDKSLFTGLLQYLRR